MIGKLFVEFLGTFLLLSVILISKGNPLAIGIVLAAVIFWGGAISGGHFNPAVSIMQLCGKQMSASEAIMYVGIQILAAVCAFMFYKKIALKYNKNE